MIRFISLLVITLSLFACTKEVTDISLIQINSNTHQDLSSADVLDDKVVIIGGDVFESGVALMGKNTDWSTDKEFSTKRLFGIDCLDDTCTAVGQDGFYYSYTDSTGWIYTRLDDWAFQRSIAKSSSHTVTVSGKSFVGGKIYHITSDHKIDTIHEYGAQLQDVAALDEQAFLAVGYGVILRSIDGGYSWNYIDQKGDFYYSVDFIDQKHGIVVGLSGSILLTDDGGLSWNTIKRPSSISQKRDAFLSVKYIDENTIYIVGDNGLLWHSTDAGQSWNAQKVDTQQNLNDLVVLDNTLYVVGDNGYLGFLQL